MVIPHTKKVNGSFILHFEFTESFGLILLYVDKCNFCISLKSNPFRIDKCKGFWPKLLASLIRYYFPKCTSVHRFILCLNYIMFTLVL